MTSTVTVTTVTTVTAIGIGASLGLIGVLTLLFLLTTRELVSTSERSVLQRAARYLLVGIVPLSFAFAVIVIGRVAVVLGHS